MTALSASWSTFSPPSNFANRHVSTTVVILLSKRWWIPATVARSLCWQEWKMSHSCTWHSGVGTYGDNEVADRTSRWRECRNYRQKHHSSTFCSWNRTQSWTNPMWKYSMLMAKSRLTLLELNVIQTWQNFYIVIRTFWAKEINCVLIIFLNCFDTAIETAWTYTYIFIVHSWFTVIYIVTKTLLPVRLCRLLNMLTVHNLLTVVYIDTETVWYCQRDCMDSLIC